MASGVFARAAMAAKEVTPGTISSQSGQPIRCSRKTQVLNNMASPRVINPTCLPAATSWASAAATSFHTASFSALSALIGKWQQRTSVCAPRYSRTMESARLSPPLRPAGAYSTSSWPRIRAARTVIRSAAPGPLLRAYSLPLMLLSPSCRSAPAADGRQTSPAPPDSPLTR